MLVGTAKAKLKLEIERSTTIRSSETSFFNILYISFFVVNILLGTKKHINYVLSAGNGANLC
ncbi:hypothetical protein [Thermoanaerobacterium aotearoense]|uniref:hypothetical protein n=1 Tax=Thermoanaerobacterium aotearoense TaxID=47490 RepID=UPI00190F1364|nr:hypothetical protein [Thermoanaerobacterium aotearoense]